MRLAEEQERPYCRQDGLRTLRTRAVPNRTAEEATCRETANPRIFASRPPHMETLGLGALHVGRCGATADLVDGHSIRRVVAMLWMIVVSIPAFTAAPAVALIFFVINLFRRRWRAAASIVLACATFTLVAVVSRRFHDELKWYVWRDHYVAQIDRLPVTPGKVRSVHWDGGSGYEVTLEYEETELEPNEWKWKSPCNDTRMISRIKS